MNRLQVLNDVVARANRLELEKKDEAAALDLIWKSIGFALKRGHIFNGFDVINQMLEDLDVEACGPHVLLGMLTVTSPASEQLKARRTLGRRVRDRFKRLDIDLIELDGLVDG